MKECFDKSLSEVLKYEGGFSNHPSDTGGATNKGITIGTYRRYKGSASVTVDQLKNITEDEVRDIYKKLYWDKVRGDELPPGLDFLTFNMAVNGGPSRGVKLLQSSLGGLDVDGIIGPNTMRKAWLTYLEPRDNSIVTVFDEFESDTNDFYTGIVERNRSQSAFIRGWINRSHAACTFAKDLLLWFDEEYDVSGYEKYL
jgi:lysozyme family protein